jgi:hypothetical protein
VLKARVHSVHKIAKISGVSLATGLANYNTIYSIVNIGVSSAFTWNAPWAQRSDIQYLPAIINDYMSDDVDLIILHQSL